MKKGSHYRRNQSSSSLFEHAQTLEALSKQGILWNLYPR